MFLGRSRVLLMTFTEEQIRELDRIDRYAALTDGESFGDPAKGIPWSLELGLPGLTSIPENFWKVQINHLRLYGELGDLPAELCRLPLTGLEIFSDHSWSLPANLEELTSLRELQIFSRSVTSLPESLSEISGLERITLDAKNLSSLPNGMNSLQRLRHLEVWSSGIQNLPEGIATLGQLTVLRFMESELTTLPAELGQLESLEVLETSGNQLRAIPASVGELNPLVTLSLDQNALESLPDLSRLDRLQALNLDENRLTSLGFGLAGLSSLSSLSASYNPIVDLPGDISACEGLQTLRLRGCGLEHVPQAIAALPLTTLDLRDNHLRTIPKWVEEMQSLRRGDLGEGLLISGNPLG